MWGWMGLLSGSCKKDYYDWADKLENNSTVSPLLFLASRIPVLAKIIFASKMLTMGEMILCC